MKIFAFHRVSKSFMLCTLGVSYSIVFYLGSKSVRGTM